VASGSRKKNTWPNGSQWIARGSALAEELAGRDDQGLRARLQVAVSALTAVASLDSPIDPELWVEEATVTSAELHELFADPLARQQIDWELGIAYFQAAQIEHRRGLSDQALQYGQQAEALLAPLASSRSGLPDTEHLLGRVYFQLGAVYAVHRQDHVEACHWYDKAAGRLLKQVPVTSMAVPGQHGDALVSMGVSYWHTGRRQRALELTQAGADLVEEAVAGGILPADALAVPYGNLSAMYKAEGEQQPATRYARLASQHEPVYSGDQRR
jgi:tetratricopeptide (TPR) repeat protein